MPEEDELTQETPEVEQEDSQEGTPSPESEHSEDYETRYKELQGTYTQSQQELAEYRDYMEKLQSDPDERRALLQELADEAGYALPDSQEDEYQDPGELALERLEKLEASQKEAQQEFEESQHWDQERERFHEALEEYQSENDLEFTKDEVEFAGARIILEGADPKEVFTALDRLGQARYERIVASKKAPRAPSGQQGSPSLDLSNREDVDQAAMEAAQEAFSQE